MKTKTGKRLAIPGIVLALLVAGGIHSCKPGEEVEAGFEDAIAFSIYDYILDNDSLYSSFLSILEAGGIHKTLSAYNPDGLGYTLFLPDNEAIERFVAGNGDYNTLDDMLADKEFVEEFSRYHVVNYGMLSDEFPFGALPEYTLSGDILTVSFIIEPDTSYYKINGQAPVIQTNIEVNNGYIHCISEALEPITSTTLDWLTSEAGCTIFLEAVLATGWEERFDVNAKLEEDAIYFTLFVEPDSVFAAAGINSFADLAARVSPDDPDYEESSNPLNAFVSYHMLQGSRFLDDFAEFASNYPTFSEIPVNVDGLGLDLLINPGRDTFEIIIEGPDTTIIDYIGFYYDNSNVLTQSGSVHLIDRVMEQLPPQPAVQSYHFWEEPLLNEYRQTPGEYLIEDTSMLYHVKWTGADLYFVETGDDDHSAWNGDYLLIDGDFVIEYNVPEIVQGLYEVEMRADQLSWNNALVEVFIDGKNMGGLLDLTSGWVTWAPFAWIELGTINFSRYEEHTVQVRSLIPGRFAWDVIRFTPYEN